MHTNIQRACLGGRCLLGFMHGLAGSAALLVLAATSINDPLHSILYVVVFGVGSIVGMAGAVLP